MYRISFDDLYHGLYFVAVMALWTKFDLKVADFRPEHNFTTWEQNQQESTMLID